jgi:hypothetical protein
MLGWVVGELVKLPPIATSALFAFFAGGLALNLLEDELPEDRGSRSWAFAAGTAGYAVLLLLTH